MKSIIRMSKESRVFGFLACLDLFHFYPSKIRSLALCPRDLRVLLVKRPDMMAPTFLAQYMFLCNIKTTYQVDMHSTKNLDAGANTVPWGAIQVLGPRQKWVDVPITFFQLSIDYLVVFYLLSNILQGWWYLVVLGRFKFRFKLSHAKTQKKKILYSTLCNFAEKRQSENLTFFSKSQCQPMSLLTRVLLQ